MSATPSAKIQGESFVDGLKSLPPLPAVAGEILEQFGDEFIEVEDVVRVVERDPGICAKLLGLANSAYFNLPSPVTDLGEAISRVLGLDTVRSIVFAMALKQTFDPSRCPAFVAQRFWLDALCARLRVAKSSRGRRLRIAADVMNLAYPAGLCHNLGLLAFVHLRPDELNLLLKSQARDPVAGGLSEKLREQLEVDHRIVTADLAAAWSMPELIVDAYRHRADSAVDGGPLGTILDASVTTVSNKTGPDKSRVSLEDTAERLGLTQEELTERAEPGDQQIERLRAVAASM